MLNFLTSIGLFAAGRGRLLSGAYPGGAKRLFGVAVDRAIIYNLLIIIIHIFMFIYFNVFVIIIYL